MGAYIIGNPLCHNSISNPQWTKIIPLLLLSSTQPLVFALKYFGGLRNLSSPLDVGIMTLKIVVVVFCTREDSNVPLCRAQAGREAQLAIDRNMPQKLSQNIEK